MGFVPIEVDDYVRLHLRINPDESAEGVAMRLRSTLPDFRAGALCACGARICVIGSAQTGRACFTCIAGEANAAEDYEITEACNKDTNSLISKLPKTPSRFADTAWYP